jgi:hypothetical protein
VAGDVVEFDPKRRRRGQPPPAAPAAPEHQILSSSSRRAAPGARELAAQQLREQFAGLTKAQSQVENARLLATGKPVPARITIALDMGGHEGPEVDIACGAVEPAVDLWECGVEQPTAEQVKLLAALTGFPVPWFYQPIEPGPLLGRNGWMVICWGGRRGCEFPEQDYVDERGVLNYGGEPPRKPPENFQSALF